MCSRCASGAAGRILAGHRRNIRQVHSKKGGKTVGEVRCLICGRVIDESELPQPDEDDDEPVKKPVMICQRCQAKLKHEADDQQKVPKPM